MEKKISIPHSIAEAVDALNGLGALLIAKQWERAAIVYAFVAEGGQGRRNDLNTSVDSPKLTPADFATLGIVGLESDKTVREYRKAWQSVIDDSPADSGLDKIKPGDKVEYPKRDWPPTSTGGAHSGPANVDAAIKRDPMIVAEAILRAPRPMIDALVKADPRGDFSRALENQRITGLPRIEAQPRQPYDPDYSADLRAATHRLLPIVHAVAEGKWQPDAAESVLIHVVAKALTMIGAGKPVTSSLFDEIEQHLKKANVS